MGSQAGNQAERAAGRPGHGAGAVAGALDSLPPAPRPVLPDVLAPGLRVVFVGSAAGAVSAARGAYYAGPGNRFWPMLWETGLTPRLLAPGEFAELPRWGIGLTDLAKYESGADSALSRTAYDAAGLAARLRAAAPLVVAFNGRAPWRHFMESEAGRGFVMASGHAGCTMVALPSTSGAARRWWDPAPWHALAARLRAA
ncbi:mismatch-specific DNA-glycosylase [Siccirubricoccus phaeus]|uniref:mismatch-specific DNA-glycosylase n=1 Tax=Siccirubricoccus phaeus TaxID=2595053 RepID=UPI001F38E0AF|nr:mismatch-specific DNA-glycosylase [Siccirubricoccus phaeus]